MKCKYPIVIAFIFLFIACNREFKGDGDTNRHNLIHDDEKRRFHVYLPKNFDESKKYPVIIALHGRYGNARKMPEMTNLNLIADEKELIIVYPNGYKRSWNDGREHGPAAEKGIDDVGFIAKLITFMNEKYPVSKKQFYAVGMSNGGFMTMRLACQLNHKIAAFASVTGGLSDDFNCQPGKHIPIMLVAGTDDPLVPYNGGTVANSNSKTIGFEDLLNFWGENNSCNNLIIEQLPIIKDDGIRAEKWSYDDCDPTCVLFKMIGAGHTWPSGGNFLNEEHVGKPSYEIDASREIVDFFLSYSLN